MRRARATYEDAYHHVMNRGIRGERIFSNAKHKKHFIKLLKELAEKFGIELYAYCIMDNHYHLVLKSVRNNLSAFMKELNGDYGLYYRSRAGGKGYVFQSRYKSTLIENDGYLRMAIIYTLLNSVRAGLVSIPSDYEWSSANEYFKGIESELVINSKVEEIFDSEEGLNAGYAEWINRKLPVYETRVGDVLGSEEFKKEAIALFNRRKTKVKSAMRIKSEQVTDARKLITDFEKEKGIRLSRIDFTKHVGKRLRAELLVVLRDEGCLTYKEILRLKYFKGIQLSSMGRIYKNSKKQKFTNLQAPSPKKPVPQKAYMEYHVMLPKRIL
ncbi:MAG: transposase [bacterium]|nr:transposase [bacterium]